LRALNYSGVIIDVGHIRVGTASWADRELVASGWYPRRSNTPAGRLAYYAESFDLVQVDTTFHAIPDVERVADWVENTPERFTFDVKAFSLFTGHRTATRMLPADLRPAGAREVRHRDLDPAVYDELWARFHAALAPAADAGKLGVVLLQFPGWLARGDKARRSIERTIERTRPHRAAVELPHPSWTEPPVVLDTLEFVQALDASYCCVDTPNPILVATAEPALVRIDGTYADPHLRDWALRVQHLADQVDEVHVTFDAVGDALAFSSYL
jgi:uncharacterized protein YecE (DUF72 family)